MTIFVEPHHSSNRIMPDGVPLRKKKLEINRDKRKHEYEIREGISAQALNARTHSCMSQKISLLLVR